MRKAIHLIWLALGVALGVAATMVHQSASQPALAFNDRHEDYVMCTGQITLGVNLQADCIWLLDYRAGKLLGTMVDKNMNKIMPWSEVDLVQEFNIPPKQNVHFMMTTGSLVKGQTSVYLTEITSGKFAMYTMVPAMDGTGRMRIFRNDASMFKVPPANPQ
jgi:hypothetical protein